LHTKALSVSLSCLCDKIYTISTASRVVERVYAFICFDLTLFSIAMLVVYSVVAVTCPKPGKTHQRGLEHAEVVIGKPEDGIYHSKPMLEAFALLHPGEQ
jgi:hypothetical protein